MKEHILNTIAVETPPTKISLSDVLETAWCADCVKFTPEETLYDQHRNTVELPDGKIATIRLATEDPAEREAILDLYTHLTPDGLNTRFCAPTEPDTARRIMKKQQEKYGSNERVDIVAVVDTTDETGKPVSEIIAHGGFFIYVDETGNVVGDQHLVVHPKYAGHYEPDPVKRAASKGKGLGTAMAQATALTAMGYDIPLVALVKSENTAMLHVLAGIPNTLRQNAGLPPLDTSPRPKYYCGAAESTLLPGNVPECTLCIFRRLGMLTVNCPARPEDANQQKQVFPDNKSIPVRPSSMSRTAA